MSKRPSIRESLFVAAIFTVVLIAYAMSFEFGYIVVYSIIALLFAYVIIGTYRMSREGK